MNPRLKTSKKWTNFPKEYQTQIESVFSDNFKSELKNSSLTIDGRIYPNEVLLCVAFGEKKGLSRNNFIVSQNYDLKSPDVVEKIHTAIDAIASLMTDFFSNEQDSSDLPRSWQEFDFNKKPLFFMYTTENPDLEREADALLGESASSLVHDEDFEEEDALDLADEDQNMSKTKH